MAVAVPSRFACLKIEDDDYRPKPTSKVVNVKNKKLEVKNHGDLKNGAKKPTVPQAKNGKKVNIGNKQAQNTAKSQSRKKKDTAEQWEQWKEKDNEFVDGNFEEDLQNAILLSKLDYEEKKDLYKQTKKEVDQPKSSESQNKKNKKKKVMTLEQFNTLVSGDSQPTAELQISAAGFDDNFFERIKCETREEVQREQSKQVRRSREPYNDVVTISQFQAELEKQRSENQLLRQELEKARVEIITVKCRNKKLCSLLGQGEMRDKAEVLVEVERLTRVQSELTGEVTRLHGLLEQERSKVGALTHDPRHKDKNKKRTNSETAPQSK